MADTSIKKQTAQKSLVDDNGSELSDLPYDDGNFLSANPEHAGTAELPAPPTTSAVAASLDGTVVPAGPSACPPPPEKGRGLSKNLEGARPVAPENVGDSADSQGKKGTGKKKRTENKQILLGRPLSYNTLVSKRGVGSMAKFIDTYGDLSQFTKEKVGDRRSEALARECIRLQMAEQARLNGTAAKSPTPQIVTGERAQNEDSVDNQGDANSKKKRKQDSDRRRLSPKAVIPKNQSPVGDKADAATRARTARSSSPLSSNSVEDLTEIAAEDTPAEESSEEEEDCIAFVLSDLTKRLEPRVRWPGVFHSSSEFHNSQLASEVRDGLKVLSRYAQRNIEGNGESFNFGPNANKSRSINPSNMCEKEKELSTYKIEKGFLYDEHGVIVLSKDVQLTVLRLMRFVRCMLDCCAYGPHPAYNYRYVLRDNESQQTFNHIREEYDWARCSLVYQIAETIDWENGLNSEKAARYLVCDVFHPVL